MSLNPEERARERAERYDHLPTHYKGLAPIGQSENALRLASLDRADHPNAEERRCLIRDHRPRPHPYGPIHADGGLTYWCPGPQESP